MLGFALVVQTSTESQGTVRYNVIFIIANLEVIIEVVERILVIFIDSYQDTGIATD